MAVYSQSFSFWAFMDRDGFKAYNHAKTRIYNHLDQTNLANKKIIIWYKDQTILMDAARYLKRAR